MPKLTKRLIDLAEPGPARSFLWDTELRGFGLIVQPSGVKSFVVQYRNAAGRTRRMTLGRYGTLTVDEARRRARAELVDVASGEDPAASKRAYREAPTLNDLFDRYVEEHVSAHNAASTAKDVAAMLRTHLRPRVGAIKANDFSRADAAKLHAALRKTPRRANHVLAILSKTLALAEVWGVRPVNSNPCGSIARFPETQRKRFLNAEEVQRLGDALVEAETVGLPWQIKAEGSKHLPPENDRRTLLSWQTVGAVRILLLTGARLSEILRLAWTDVDAGAGTLALPDRKGGARVPHPVNAAALAVIAALPRAKKAVYVFPRDDDPKQPVSKEALESAWARVRWRAGIPDVRLHDLRHTVGTYASQAGVSSFIVRDLLRHSNITMTGRYANFDSDPVREVANKVGTRIETALSSKPPARPDA
ncbi:MAG: site-specific integrase [Beijerinckiaceae bacterium]|nr:site-specific integrase [Beijerinckiaceae bacterium]